jgi:hypothetical protein
LCHWRIKGHASREHGLRQQRRREGLCYRTDFINRVAIGRLAVIELAEGHDLAVVAVHHAEHQRLISARRNAFLRSLFHALWQRSGVRRPVRHEAYSEKPRSNAAVQ